MDLDLWNIIIGGGGTVGIITALVGWTRDRRQGKMLKEDTAITRLKDDYDRKKREAEKAWRIVGWFRTYYPLLWAAYIQYPDSKKDEFPPTPPPDIGN